MFSKELQDYILHRKEERNIEYKDSMSWADRGAKLKIIKGMLAMANLFQGGVIVVGMKQDKNLFDPVGMKQHHFDSYNYDDIGRYVRNHSDPIIEFKLERDVMDIAIDPLISHVGKEKRKFCIIQIAETRELPVISTRLELINLAEKAFQSNIGIREGAVYIRSKSPIESREIQNQEEWRELLYRCIEKLQIQAQKMSRPIKRRPIKPKQAKKRDENKFNRVLKRDKLL